MSKATQSNSNLLAIGAFVLGFLIGLFVFGWGLTPTTRGINAGPQHFDPVHLDEYIRGLSFTYGASGNNPDVVMRALCYPTADFEAVTARRQSGLITDTNIQTSYDNIIGVVNAASGCDTYKEQDGNQPVGGSGFNIGSLLQYCLMGLALLAILAAGYYLLSRRGSGSDEDDGYNNFVDDDPAPEPPAEPKPEATRRRRRRTVTQTAPPPPVEDAPATRVLDSAPQPLAGFQSSYSRGDDAFDKSFIIENGNGDFLGECGVSISESIGAQDGVKNVTAFEIWLFDKNDTHTVTKVVMSDHAFADDGVRAKLATRGEPVQAQYDNTIVLETASLIINAEVTEIDYNDSAPSNGIFDRFTVDLSAWVKSGGAASSVGADDLLEY